MVRCLTLGFFAVLVAACSGIELVEDNPIGVDLTGSWVLDYADSDATPDFKQGLGGRKRARRTNDQVIKQRNDVLGALGSGFAFVVHDFQILSADSITVEQNHDSMGIAHEPGVYRDVSWGERQRGLWEVYAGWEEQDLVILSKAPDMSVLERYIVKRDRMTVELTIEADDEERTVRRIFNRK
ncbi:MAG: hypothetical protein GKR90_14405 [Pseudomonadales bacterium]|nr:hypothetical protein [Pseudomonadales bacterium]